MSSPIQNTPYLPQQRNFPNSNLQALTVEIDNSYIQIAYKMNEKESGIYPVNAPIVTCQQWYLSGQPNKQQTLRQVYNFTAAGNIAHGINWSSVALISAKSYGTFTDGTSWYGVIYGSSTTIAGQVSFYVTSTNIVVGSGAGAPAITNGYIVLEWLSNF